MQIVTGKEKLAGKVSLTLAAGMLTAVPAVQAAPVLDSGSNPYSGGVSVDQSVANLTAINSSELNNLIKWQDFSVNQGETVRFDDGANTNNYLNVVTSSMTSQIHGAIEGGNNVYVVNPNGINIGEGANIDVGNLYLSTRPLDEVDMDVAAANAANQNMSPLINASVNMAADVVNNGTLKADTVVVEGDNITFLNSADILDNGGVTGQTGTLPVNTDVTAKANKILEVGHDKDDTSETVNSYNAEAQDIISSTIVTNDNVYETMVFRRAGNGNSGQNSILAQDPQSYDSNNGSETNANVMNGNYILADDIDFSDSNGNPTFIAAAGTNANPFTGTFNGNFHKVSNFKVKGDGINGAGLFGVVRGTASNPATIKNLGVENATINTTGGTTAHYAGGVVGKAEYANIENVYVANSTVYKSNWSSGAAGGKSAFAFTGGVVGYALQSTVDGAYIDANTKVVDTNNGAMAGGIVGVLNGSTVTNVYSLGKSSRGIIYDTVGTNNTVSNGYYSTENGANAFGPSSGFTRSNLHVLTKDSSGHYTVQADGSIGNSYPKLDATHYQSYSFLDENSTKGGQNTTWRIYEGKSLPYLRAFMTAKGTAYANYDYTIVDVNGNYRDANGNVVPNGTAVSNNGADIDAGQYKGYTYTIDPGTITYKDSNGATLSATANDLGISGTNYNANGVKNVAYYNAGTTANPNYKYDLPHSMVWGGQQGYDIVGGNLTITRAPVQARITPGGLDKVYDGVATESYSGSNSSAISTVLTGVVAGDDIAINADLNLSYTDNSGNAVSDVGQHNAELSLNGSTGQAVTFVTALSRDANGNVLTSEFNPNYKWVDANGNAVAANAVVYTGIGNIHPRSLVLDTDNVGTITKTYDGNTDIVGSTEIQKAKDTPTIDNSASYTTPFNFEAGLIGAGEHGIVQDAATGQAQNVSLDTNALQFAYDNKNAGDRNINFTGLALSGQDAHNYRLVDANGNIIWQPANTSLASVTDSNGNSPVVGTSTTTFAQMYGNNFTDSSGNSLSFINDANNFFTTDNGHIDPKDLANTDFYWTDNDQANGTVQTVEKNYDTTSDYNDANTHNVFTNNMIAADRDLFNFTVQSADFTNQANGGSVTANATDNAQVGNDKAQGVKYEVTIGAGGNTSINDALEAAQNYTLGGQALTQTTGTGSGATTSFVTNTLDVYGNSGRINQRELWLTLGSGANVDKTYDGDAAVKTDSAGATSAPVFNAADSAVTNVTYSTETDAGDHQILNNNATINVTGKYGDGTGAGFADNKNVNWDNANNVIDRNIQYTVTLADNGTAGAAGNYTVRLGGVNDNSGANINGSGVTYTIDGAAGKINPKSITDVTFADVDKTYDASADIINRNDIQITGATGLIAGENAAQLLGYDTANYGGTYVDGNGTADSHVAWAPNTTDFTNLNNVVDKTINYDVAGITFTGDRNYTLDITTATGQGKITPATINDFDLVRADSITKVYDSTTDVLNGATSATYTGTGTLDANTHLGALTHTFTDNNGAPIATIDVGYDVTGAAYASPNSNNSTAQNVTYTLTNLAPPQSASGYHDYTIDGSQNITINNATTAQNGTGSWNTTFAGWGTITPRDISATIDTTPFKTYDNTDSANYDSNGNAISANAPAGLVTVNNLVGSDSYTATATFVDGNGNGVVDAGTHNVKYDVAINTADQSNYNLTGFTAPTVQDAAGNNVTLAHTENLANKTATVTDGGSIGKRDLTVTFGPTTKTYDGTSSVLDATTQKNVSNLAGGDTEADVLSFGGNGIFGNSLAAGTGDNFAETVHVNANAAKYTGLNLLTGAGQKGGNYRLVDGNGNALASDANGYYTFGNGTITPLTIDNNYTLTLVQDNPITKVYDGNADVAHNGTAEAGNSNPYFVGDLYYTISRNDGTTQNVYFTYDVGSATYNDKNVAYDNSGNITDKNVTYNLTNIAPINATSTTSGSPYNDVIVNTGATNRSYDFTGQITPKSVTAEVIGTPTKTYDNNNTLPSGAENYLTLNGIVSGDSYTTNGTYDDINAGTKDVTYTVNLGGNAGNYTIDGVTVGQDANGNSYAASAAQNAPGGSTFNVTDGGKISKAQLTLDFGANDKPYDTSADVDMTNATLTVNGLQGNDATTYGNLGADLLSQTDANNNNARYITGQYGEKSNGTFTPDANVRYDANNNIVDKWVQYTGMDNALAAYSLANNSNLANNYDIASLVEYAPDDIKGKITKQVIASLKERWNGNIDKVYDATDAVSDRSKAFYNLYAVSNTNEETPFTAFTLAANYDDKNAANGKEVTYTVSNLNISGLGRNFDITDPTVTSQLNDYSSATGVTKTLTQYNNANPNNQVTANITPLEVTVTALQNDKIYNGTTDADPSKLTIDSKVLAVMARDNTTSTVNAVYANVNANADKDGNLLAGQTNGTVNYTIGLSGDGNVGTNYTLNNAYTGTGNIKQREIAVGVDSNATKIYDATTNYADAANAAFTQGAVKDANGNDVADTGIVTVNGVQDNIQFDATGAKGKYNSANVANANEVTYSGYRLNNSNYVLHNDTVSGNGTITKRQITANLAQTTGLDKEYDGTSNVTEPYRLQNVNFAVDNSMQGYAAADTSGTPTNTGTAKAITVTWNDIDDNGNAIQHQDTVNITLQKAVYAVDDGAGGRREVTDANEDPTTGVLGVDYVLGWDDDNYELVPVNLNGEGMIKRRTITLDEDRIADATKTYDGTDSVVNPANNLIPAFRHNNNGTDEDGIVAGDNLNISFDRDIPRQVQRTVERQEPVLDGSGAPVLDADGNPTYTTVYDTVTETVYDTIQDAKYQPGQQVLKQYKTVQVQRVDASGNPLYEADGVTPIYDTQRVQATDASGNPLYEADGVTPVYEVENVRITDENGNIVDKNVDYTADQAWLDESIHKFNHITHKVIYNFTVNNPNYKLVDENGNETGTPATTAADGTVTAANYATATGEGTIDRANITANANSVYASSDNIPESFSGTVRGLDGTNYGNDFEWKRSGGATESGEGYAKYPIYGWYKGNTEGAYGMNYYFTQAESNAKALNVSWSTTPTPEPQPEPEPEPTVEPVTPTPYTPPVIPSSDPEPVVVTPTEPTPTVTPAAPEPVVVPAAEPVAVPTVEPEPTVPVIEVPSDVSSVTSFTPDSTSYTQASHDFSSAFSDNSLIGLTTTGSNVGNSNTTGGAMNLTSGGANTGAVDGLVSGDNGTDSTTNGLSNANGLNNNGNTDGGMDLADDSTNLDGSNNLVGFKANGKNDGTANGDMSLTSEGASVGKNGTAGNGTTTYADGSNNGASADRNGNGNNASSNGSNAGNSTTGKANANANGYYTDRNGNSRNGNGQIINRSGQSNGVRISSERATKNKMASINIDVESDNAESADEEERLEEERRRNRQKNNDNNRRNAIGFQAMGQGINLSPGDMGKLSA